MNRISLAEKFDEVIAYVAVARENDAKPSTYWLAKLEMAINELRRQSVLNAASLQPCFDPATIERSCSQDRQLVLDIVHDRLLRSLYAYSPLGIEPKRATKVLIELLTRVGVGDEPNRACEAVSLRYCGIFGIVDCSPDTVYLEILVRESIGLYGDIPPTPKEQIASISMASKILGSINERSSKTAGSSNNQNLRVTRAA